MDIIINTYGTRIRSSGERIVLVLPGKQKKKEYAARRVEKIMILRPSSISTGAVELALRHEIDIVYLGSFGKPIGRIFSSQPKGMARLRKRQIEASTSPKSLEIAKAFVKGKARNQSERYGKLALVLDLVEEFRVPIVDASIFPLFVNRELMKKDYTRIAKGEYMLSDEGKRKIVEAVYNALNTKMKWGSYNQPLKNIIKYQARKLARVFLGKEKQYTSFDYRTML